MILPSPRRPWCSTLAASTFPAVILVVGTPSLMPSRCVVQRRRRWRKIRRSRRPRWHLDHRLPAASCVRKFRPRTADPATRHHLPRFAPARRGRHAAPSGCRRLRQVERGFQYGQRRPIGDTGRRDRMWMDGLTIAPEPDPESAGLVIDKVRVRVGLPAGAEALEPGLRVVLLVRRCAGVPRPTRTTRNGTGVALS